MGSFASKDFGGEIPRRDPHELPDNMAEAAWNCDLAAGVLDGLRIPQAVVDLSSFGTVRRAYRVPGTGLLADTWLPLPSEYSSVVRSPLANDSTHRIYWTNPSQGAFWSNYARIAAGNTGANAPYNLGTVAPTVQPSIASVSGGSGVVVSRSYVYTFVNSYGEESAPSVPSNTGTGYLNGTWNITNLPTVAPSNPGGKNYPPITGMWLYRTVSGLNTGATYYRTKFWNFSSPPGGGNYADASTDADTVLNPTLESASWANPPDTLDGIVQLPGGMLVGFTNNTVHFCEPNRPHAWPAGYDQSVAHDIVALAVWQQSLIVLTQGPPSTGSGTSPASFTLQQVQVMEPCIARGSVVVDMAGVYYASQNGLIELNFYGMTNQSLKTLTKNTWLNDFSAASIVAARHRASYLAINGTGTGFIIEFTEDRLGIVNINTFSNAVCVWNDPYTGVTYICADKIVYEWDAAGAGTLNYRWRSKKFAFPAPENFGAMRVSLGIEVLDPPPVGVTIPLDNGDSRLVIPNDCNAVMHWYRGDDSTLMMTKKLTQQNTYVRLPAGYKDHTHQFEIVSRARIFSVEVATTNQELKNV